MIGHRGAMGYAPENTLLSINKAIELGADWVEVDVYLVDEELIVIHDDTLDRTTNGHGRLVNYSFEELRKLDAGQGQKIPTLQEVIDVTCGVVGLNVELKGEGTAAALVDLVSNMSHKEKERVIISSFLMSELMDVFQLDKYLKIGVLASKNMDCSFNWALKLKAFSIHISKQDVTRELIERAHHLGLKLYAYTVNEQEEIKQIKKMGADGVFSNYPDRR